MINWIFNHFAISMNAVSGVIGESSVMPVALLAVMGLSNMTRYVLFIICDFHFT